MKKPAAGEFINPAPEPPALRDNDHGSLGQFKRRTVRISAKHGSKLCNLSFEIGDLQSGIASIPGRVLVEAWLDDCCHGIRNLTVHLFVHYCCELT